MSHANLKSIHIRDFKNLDNCKIDLENITAIVGANNSGKSNFLEVFNLIKFLFYINDEDKNKFRYLFSSIPFSKNEKNPKLEINFDFLTEDEPTVNCNYKLEIEFEEETFIIKNEIFEYKELSKKGPYKSLFHRERSVVRLRTEKKDKEISPRQSAASFIKAIFPSYADLPSEDYFYLLGLFEIAALKLFNVHNIDKYNILIKDAYPKLYDLQESKDAKFLQFKDAFLDILGFQKLTISKVDLPESPETKFYFGLVQLNPETKMFRIEESSDGSKIMFLMLFQIFLSEQHIIIIDEPEIGLHPQAISKFLALFVKKSIEKQLLFTTHSTFILNYLSPKLIYVIEKDEKDRTHMIRASNLDNLNEKLRSPYVQFGDMFANSFKNIKDEASLE